jgi:selenocysteine lyase/cysteine desulfurase
LKDFINVPADKKPVVLYLMEHHSNQTSWLETIADVAVIPATEDGLLQKKFRNTSRKYKDRSFKINYFLL